MFKQVGDTILENGARVVTARSEDAESVCVGIFTGVGGRHEPARLSGASHFIEHMLFKGTKRRKAVDISRAIEGRGGYFNAYTSESSTCYYARLPYEFLPQGFDVLADMYLNATLPAVEMEKERLVILEELRMYRDQPQHVVQEQFSEALWKNHPLGRPLIGSEASLTAITRDDLAAFKAAHYQPRGTLFVFTGRVNHETCVRLVRGTVDGPATPRPPAFSRVTGATRQQHLALTRRGELEQVHLVAGHRIFGRRDEDRYALRLLNAILGENMSSRLFQVVRERHGFAYAIQSGYQLHAETGSFSVSAGLDCARAMKALRLIMREVNRLCETPVSAAELRRARDYTLGTFRLGLESAGNQMAWLGDAVLNYGRVVPPEETIEAIRAVTPGDILRTAQRCFTPERLTLSLVLPDNHPADGEEWLAECGV